MNRPISYAMLVCFVAQQFVCCCADDRVSTSNSDDQAHSISQREDLESQGNFGHDHQHDGGPANRGHHHHVCVGTHLFYRSAERFHISRIFVADRINWSWADLVELLSPGGNPASGCGAAHRARDSIAMTRSALGVYRI